MAAVGTSAAGGSGSVGGHRLQPGRRGGGVGDPLGQLPAGMEADPDGDRPGWRRTGHGRVSGPARWSSARKATRSMNPSGTTHPGPPSP